MRAPFLLLLATGWACSDGEPDPNPADSASVALAFRIEANDDEDWTLDTLEVRVDELVWTADGPDGEASVARSAGETVSVPPDGATTTLDLTLDPGRYNDVLTTVHLRPGLDPALHATGTVDGEPFRLDVTMEVGLEGDVGSVELGPADGIELRCTFRPDAWLGELDLEDLEPTGDLLLIDATHNVSAYFSTVERIEESSETEVEASR